MARLLAGILGAALVSAAGSARAELPPTKIRYDVEVSLDPATRRLEGRETIRWTNPGRETIRSVPLHLYLNAFSHLATTWMRGVPAGRLRADELLALHDDPWGWTSLVKVEQSGKTLEHHAVAPDDGNPFDRTLVDVTLAEPVEGGETAEIAIVFSARLPVPIARTGGRDGYFFVGQWFPKVATYETVGVRGSTEEHFDRHQFHGPTEFYADFADYDVRIGAPPGWLVGATGAGEKIEGKSDGGRAWYRYRQRAVHDFAFVVGRDLTDARERFTPKGNERPVEMRIVVPRGTQGQIPRWKRALRGALDTMTSRVGPYPYETITVVLPPFYGARTAGMEYPTLITGMFGDPLWDSWLLRDLRVADMVIAHEFAHQYFYGLVASNEFEEAFLDEGFTEYWTGEIQRDLFGDRATEGWLLGRPMEADDTTRWRIGDPKDLRTPVRSRPSFLVDDGQIGPQFYRRPSSILRTAALRFGQERVDRVFAEYFARWKFRHPRFEDFLAICRAEGGADLGDFVEEAFSQPSPPDVRIESLSARRFEPPLGRIEVSGKTETIDRDSRERFPLAGLGSAPLERDGRVVAAITDPGRFVGGDREPGRILRRALDPERASAAPGFSVRPDVFFVSEVRVSGSEWEHLPTQVVFRFADGVVVRDDWDGRARSRSYRFVRGAPLVEARLDPRSILVADPNPMNDGRRRDPSPRLSSGWPLWLAAAFQWLAAGVTQWL